MLRNFIRQSQPWTMSVSPTLGRWRRNDNINRKVDLANIDNCGDRVCGDLYDEMKSEIKLFDKRWSGEISKEDFNKGLNNLKKNMDDCDQEKCACVGEENIDSHDNSLYHKSLKAPYNNDNYSIQSIVNNYNERWNKNLTIEEYVKNFTRFHRGAC